MAENINVTEGSGKVVAGDDIGGVLFQRIKLVIGADGVNDGDVSSANPVPISVASLPLPSGAATQTTLAAILTELQLKADLTETQPVSAVSLPLPTGASTSANQATIIGHVDGIEALLTTIDADTGSMATNLTSIAAEDFATQTTLAALLAELQLKADLTETQPVSAASLPLPTGASTSANQSTIIGHLDGVEGLLTTIDADTGTIATEVAGLLTDTELRASPVPVSGTVTANAGTNLNTSALALESGGNLAGAATSLAILDDWDETDRAKVNIIAGQVGVAGGTGVDAANVQRVSLATDIPLPAGTNAIGKLSANSGVDIGDVDVTSLPSLPAGTNNIGDVDVLSLPAIPAGTNNIGDVDVLTLPSLPAGTNNIGDVDVLSMPAITVTGLDSGFSNVEFIRNDYGSVNVTTSAYVELIASTANAYKEIEIFDSSGSVLKIAFGAAASEVDKMLVFPGGNGTVRLAVPASTRVSIKAVDASATSGMICINFRG